MMGDRDEKYTRHAYKLIKASPYFDAKWYVKKYPDVAASGLDAVAHYLMYGWREKMLPGPYFDGNYYLELHPKVREADMNPLLHYEQHGRGEHRSIGYLPKVIKKICRKGYFDKRWYVEQYPDVCEYGLEPVVHYLLYGWKKGYNPSKKFNTQFYLSSNQDVNNANVCPLLHYISYGRKEGRMIMGASGEASGIHKNRFISYVVRKYYQFTNRDRIRRNSGRKIAVQIHLYYTQLWHEIKGYLKNLEPYQYELYITHTKEIGKDIESDIRDFKSDVVFYQLSNKGFDLGPFIYFLHQIKLADYDVIFKLHTKRDVKKWNYYGLYMEGGEWRRMLYDGILSARNVHHVIDDLSSANSRIGLVANDRLIVAKDMMYYKEKVVKAMVSYHFPMPLEYKYVAGTMYAIKPQLLQVIKEAVDIESFDETERGVFTLAHCFERILCLIVGAQGYEMKGTKTTYWNSWIRHIQSKIHPHRELPLLNADLVKEYTFYKCRGPQGIVEISSLLKEKDETLYYNLLTKGNIEEGLTEVVNPDSMAHAQLLQSMIDDRVVARLVSAIDITTFRLVGEKITVEKKARLKYRHRMRVYDQAQQFLLSGTYLSSQIKEILAKEESLPELEHLLIPYVEEVFRKFRTNGDRKLSPHAWDAIPRNTIINEYGNYNFFDLNIACLPGVEKSYFLFRVVRDVHFLAREMGLSMKLDNFGKLYTNLCVHFQLNGNFEECKKAEARYLKILRSRLPFFSEIKEWILYWFYTLFKVS